ncbi:MAG: Lrp/AsnC ligand binding domain-containing protein [Nitrososphaerota archaeon]|nr:Lrp/AsnC ligand binding domain-containing protein [Nitrososphaerota archaeon]MDG6927593.1 Lrp/AsnC ligand binding domain-containing protein [Nitrososphaerota archaeon]MDG6929916.1 Lrp/AsnC ligand binding domain-containing protein [Nitrososphaerota archaeon]MDG6931634.1 Lrp/AsnC ligand binding domain-containing protein [Nitrososphaerota archaeon]MDG6935949.1 Lrp/AsnC ligand binding domain-containing protein [Nitrososphaerota archaeon]
MATAYVLINADMGSENDVLKELKNISGINEAYLVYGVYDIIAKVEAETMEQVKEVITWKVRRLEKVRSTLSMIVME